MRILDMTTKKAQDLEPGDTLERWNGPATVESVTVHPDEYVQVKTDASPLSDAIPIDSDVEVQ